MLDLRASNAPSHSFKSGVLFGVGDDAAYLADCIATRR